MYLRFVIIIVDSIYKLFNVQIGGEELFNQRSRSKNMLRISTFSTIASIINILVQFVYRTLFLSILTKEYLGIEGLFSNIIQILSLTELGIGTIIAYRLYGPLEEKNIERVSAIMEFFRKTYFLIAIVITTLGVLIIPILKYLIKDHTEIPTNVSLYIVYILFLSQSISSYFFTYKQTILIADQRGEIVAIYNTFTTLLKSIVQIGGLYVTHDYQFSLFASILIGIILNWGFSLYIDRLYKDIFAYRSQISAHLKKEIFYDLKATLCHKIGGVISTSTDNLILSTFVGLGKLGVYSNYTLIIEAVKKIIIQALGNFTASIGNATLQMDREKYYMFYEKLLIINFCCVDITSICLLVLINPFIKLWQGDDMIFSFYLVAVIVACYYINTVRLINISFTNASGLFAKDIVRPLIEDALNLILSIYLVREYGIIGVFAGTIISHLLTVGWREPLILYKYLFQKKISRYWFLYFKNLCVICVSYVLLQFGFHFDLHNYFQWTIQAIISSAVTFVILMIFFYGNFKKVVG